MEDKLDKENLFDDSYLEGGSKSKPPSKQNKKLPNSV